MYQQTIVVMTTEGEPLEVEVAEAGADGVLIRAGQGLTVFIDWQHASELVADLMNVLPPALAGALPAAG